MKVLRVQNKNKQGCYTVDEQPNEIAVMTYMHNCTRPTPQDDKYIRRYPKSNERCGFLNEMQLYNWFSDSELKMLKFYGFNIVEIDDVKITAIGAMQVLFKNNRR